MSKETLLRGEHARFVLAVVTVLIMAVPTGMLASVSHYETAPQEPSAKGDILFSDNFDDGTLDKWFIGPWNPAGIMDTTSSLSRSKSYSAHSQSSIDDNTAPYICAEFDNTSNFEITHWIYLPEKSRTYDKFNLLTVRALKNGLNDMPDPAYSEVGKRTTYLLGVELYDNDYSIDIYERMKTPIDQNRTIYDMYKLTPETWHNISLRVIGSDYLLYVDGQMIYSGERYGDVPLNVTMFGDGGGSGGGSGDAYLDDVVVTQLPDEASVDLSVSGISFSNDTPTEGDNTTISATIHGDYDSWENTTRSEILFSDNFDDGTLNRWFIGHWNPEGIMEATDTLSHSSDYSAHSQSDPDTNTAPFIAAGFNETHNLSIEGYFYLPQKTQEYDSFRLFSLRYAEGGLDNLGDSSKVFNRMNIGLIDDDYNLDVWKHPSDEAGNIVLAQDTYQLQPQTWYKADIIIEGSLFKVYINDEFIFESNNDINTSYPFNVLIFGDIGGSGGCWGDAYLDDVTITGYTHSSAISHHAQNATCTVSFYLDNVSENNLIYRENNVFVPANGEVTVNAPWNAVAGNHSIIVKVENVNPEDTDYTNNVASAGISVSSPNIPPVAVAGDDRIVNVGDTVYFDGSGSYDPDGYIVSYSWNFGNGDSFTSESANASHVFTDPGVYNVTLTVTDNEGATGTDTCMVTVISPVPAELNISSVLVSGPETGEICQPYEWSINITVTNTGEYEAQNVVVFDAIPEYFIPHSYHASKGFVGGGEISQPPENGVMSAPSHPHIDPITDPSYEWHVGSLAPGETAYIVFNISTSDSGICSSGIYHLDDGASVTATDTLTGNEIYAGPTSPISVDIIFPAKLEISEELVSGPETGHTNQYYEWEIMITVSNTGEYAAEDVVLSDAIPDYITPLNYSTDIDSTAILPTPPSSSIGAMSIPSQPVIDPIYPDSYGLDIGEIGPKESVHIWINVSTNDTGFVLPDTYNLDYGASVTGIDNATGKDISAGPSGPVSVNILLPAELTISKVRVSGPESGYIHQYYEWSLLITVSNIGGYSAENVVVSDEISYYLILKNYSADAGQVNVSGVVCSDESGGGTRSAPSQPKSDPIMNTGIEWNIGALSPGEEAHLIINISTKVMGFCHPGTYSLNDGATVSGTDTATENNISAGPTNLISVQIGMCLPPRDPGTQILMSSNPNSEINSPISYLPEILVIFAAALFAAQAFRRKK